MDVTFDTAKGIFNYRVAAVWIKNGCVLLHKDMNDEEWALPGGRVTFGERADHALKRELEEELGVKASVEKLLWTTENFFQFKGRTFHEIAFYYHVVSDEKEWQVEPFYGLEGERLVYRWAPISEIHKYELKPVFLQEVLLDWPNTSGHYVIEKMNERKYDEPANN